MWEPRPGVLKGILRQASHPRLKVCFDCGHANVFGTDGLDTWVDEIGSDLTYMHWNDNLGDADTELPVGRGNIDWGMFTAKTNGMAIPPQIVLEVGSLENVKQSLTFLSGLDALDSNFPTIS